MVRLFPLACEDLVDGAVRLAPAGDQHVARGGIARHGQGAVAEGVVRVHHGDEVILEQGLGAQLRGRGGADHSGLEVQLATAQGAALLVGFGQKVEPHPGGLDGEARQQGGAHRLHEAVTGSQAESALQARRVYFLLGAQHGPGLLNQAGDLIPQGLRPGGGDQAASRPHQQRIPRGLPQPCQGPAHGGSTQA